MIITIAGPPGSGKDTVARNLAKKLNYVVVSIGNIKREAAKSKGMTIEQFNSWSKVNPKEGDIYFDDFIKSYGVKNDNFIMVARLGWYLIPSSKKIFLNVDSKIGAERIFKQKQNLNERKNSEHQVHSIEEQENLNQDRIDNERERFLKLYGADPYSLSNYDLIIDSSNSDINKIIRLILEDLSTN